MSRDIGQLIISLVHLIDCIGFQMRDGASAHEACLSTTKLFLKVVSFCQIPKSLVRAPASYVRRLNVLCCGLTWTVLTTCPHVAHIIGS